MVTSYETQKIKSVHPLNLNLFTRKELRSYFQNTWKLYEILFSAIKDDETYYLNPDPLRNALIFYLGHTASFYINKLKMTGLLKEGINERYEVLFAKGVDPDLPENLEEINLWPTVDEVRAYRLKVYETVIHVIENVSLELPVKDNSPLWALMMGLEHDRIHFETSSVLIRQLPVSLVSKPIEWFYAPTNGKPSENKMIAVNGGVSKIGKPEDAIFFGWDNEYGSIEERVQRFEASKNLISNFEYLEFVTSGAYNESKYWSEEGKEWKERVNALYPKFWLKDESDKFKYRAMFDEIELPLDWPVEVNAHEAWAYCKWKGENWRLLSETEYNLIAKIDCPDQNEPVFSSDYNLNIQYGSPTPVGFSNSGKSLSGFNDIFGNVWDWLGNDFYPLYGFKTHHLYEDFSAPYFDPEHSMLLGGAWSTTGTGASRFYRLWFRRDFFQHAGFRIARSL